MSKEIEATIVAAFVDERGGGNRAAVVLDRTDLSESHMQDAAAQLALSETVFVQAAPEGYRLDFFTPNKRVPDCGHATVAAFGLLAERGRIRSEHTVKQTINGPRAIRLNDGEVFMQQLPASFSAVSGEAELLASLGLTPDVLAAPPVVARHDVSFIIVPLDRAETLSRIVPELERIAAITGALDAIGFYVVAPGTRGVDVTARMFAPGFGIPEESATGMAAGLVTAYLYERAGRRQETYAIEQGAFMSPPSPSLLRARPVVRDGAIAEVWVGGRSRTLESRRLTVS